MRSANSSSSPNAWTPDRQSGEINHPSESLTTPAGAQIRDKQRTKQAAMPFSRSDPPLTLARVSAHPVGHRSNTIRRGATFPSAPSVSTRAGPCLPARMKDSAFRTARAGAGMTWTEERIERLKELWGEGLSASQIAAEFGGDVSRNAVLGKAHRLGLAQGGRKGASTPRPRKPTRPLEPA